MTFAEYVQLEKRAKECGIGNDPVLKKAFHILQVRNLIQDRHTALMRELKNLERICAEEVEKRIEEVEQNIKGS